MQKIREAVKLIKEGKVLVCPTDTVYGLVADAANKKAVEKIFKIKKRKKEKPIPIFIRNLKQAKTLAQISKDQEKFLKKAWPGKVTAVLTRRQDTGSRGKKIYGIDKRTIALRIPKYKLINQLLEKVNCPLTGTSANISGKPASTKIKEVASQFKNQKFQPDLIINEGNLKPSKPSKVIDLTSSKPKILRK
ncbi:MAG: L-threonylcarbamoyladenylate synthase [bacterium]